jgi:serine/threonine kinase 16
MIVWALGCLLFAMAFGYSPFECTFHKETGEVRVIECTYLGVIGSIRFPRTHPFSVQFCDLISWMLTQDVVTRPNIFQVIERVHPLGP